MKSNVQNPLICVAQFVAFTHNWYLSVNPNDFIKTDCIYDFYVTVIFQKKFLTVTKMYFRDESGIYLGLSFGLVLLY